MTSQTFTRNSVLLFGVLGLAVVAAFGSLTLLVSGNTLLIAGLGVFMLCMVLAVGFGVLSCSRSGDKALARTLEQGSPDVLDGDSALDDILRNLLTEKNRYKDMRDAIVKGLPTPYLFVDTDERTLSTNRETLDMLEIDGDVDKQLGKTLAELFYNDPGRTTAVGKAMHNGETFRNLEVTINGHKGGVRHVLANVYALRDSNGKCLGGFCLYIDMTVLKEKDEELAERNRVIIEAADQAETISDQLAAASEELSTQVEESSASSRSSMEITASVAGSVDQMNAAVLDVARKASETSELSSQAESIALDGEKVVQEVIKRISDLETRANELSGNMQSLSTQADSIGSIMSVITDIADQTNLLALSAAIEAARAGDAGRGFAVVADEVRKLAEKTMEATRQVEQNIGSIQESTRLNVSATEVTAKEVGDTVHVVERAGEALTRIVEISQQTSGDIESIAAAAEQQSSSSEEIARSTGEIGVAARQTAAAMDESAQALGDLARLATQLHDVIHGMRA